MVGISVNSKFPNSVAERQRQIARLKLCDSSLSTHQILDMKNLKTIKIVYSRAAKFPQQFIEALMQLKKLKNVHLTGQFEKSSFVKVGALKHLKRVSFFVSSYNISQQEFESFAELREV